jgi:hypothetical protein
MTARGINRRLDFTLTDALKRRFWPRVAKAEGDACWLWTAAFRNGYGAIKHEGKVLSAHKLSYIIANGFPADGLVIAHKCDNRGCCNPAHLEAVTPGTNNRDARVRVKFHNNHGADAPNAVLTDEIVMELRKLHARHGWGGRKLKAVSGIEADPKTLDDAAKGKTWKHVPMPTNATLGLLEGVQ